MILLEFLLGFYKETMTSYDLLGASIAPMAERWQKGTVRMHLVTLSWITVFQDLI